MKYTSLLLDLDNTLLDFDMAEAAAIRRVLKANGLPCSESDVKTYSAINKSFWERFERGEIPKTAIYAGRFEKLLAVFGRTGDPEALSREYGGYLAEGYFKTEGADGILEYLRGRGYKLYATTNGFSATQHRRIKGAGLENAFDRVFVSEDAGAQKPEKEYFDYVLKNIPERDISKLLIVGDSMSSDILGGINAGIDTCWYNPRGAKMTYLPTYEIKSLSELKNIL